MACLEADGVTWHLTTHNVLWTSRGCVKPPAEQCLKMSEPLATCTGSHGSDGTSMLADAEGGGPKLIGELFCFSCFKGERLYAHSLNSL